MSARVWLDDVRPAPIGYTHTFKTADECIEFLEKNFEQVEHISLDHDLADEHFAPGNNYMSPYLDRSMYKEKTGYAVLEWMHEQGKWVPDISVHTMNPPSARDMMNKLRNSAPLDVTFRRVHLMRGE